jgi:UDP:flavonoid glycosyltransferase YjiC (YdhE family)
LLGGRSLRPGGALFTTQPGFGHLNPMLPYAVAMRDAGHEVRFATAAAFAEAIEQHEFACAAIGYDFTWEQPERYFPAIADAARAGRSLEYANFEITWKHWNPRAARDLLALFEEWRPDVIIREFAENGATFAGETAAIPVVCASWSALPNDGRRWGSVVDWDRTLECYDTVRRELGVAPDRPGAAWERQLVLTGLPRTWFRGAGSAPVVRHFRLPLTEGRPQSPPSWLHEMGRDRPLVYATLGTVFNRLRRVRTALLEALAELDVDVLMTVGRNVDPRHDRLDPRQHPSRAVHTTVPDTPARIITCQPRRSWHHARRDLPRPADGRHRNRRRPAHQRPMRRGGRHRART